MLLSSVSCLAAADPLADGFDNPPEQTKPWCYWYWISDNISKEGITRDLEAMRRVGIGEALIGNIYLSPEDGGNVPPGKIKVLSPEWWALVEHAIREGGRVGVNIGLFNCPGWSQSGGPWIKPEQTMRYLTSSEIRVTGPRKLDEKLPQPAEQFQDVALMAFPAPESDADALAARSPRITCNPTAADAGKLVDGRLDTAFAFPEGSLLSIDIEVPEPLTARSLQVYPADYGLNADAEFLVAGADGTLQTVRRFPCDWSNPNTAVGFLRKAPVSISFGPITSRHFRLVLTNVRPHKGATLAEIKLSGAARLEYFVEKQLGKMHQTPLPMWDAYLWPAPAEPGSAKFTVPAGEVRDLAGNFSADHTLRWDVPPGEWVIQRIGMTPTGMSNSPASPEGRGFEVDKMNRKLARHHFDAFVGELLRRMPASERKALKHVVADSYEMGAQNWTDGFDARMREGYGYDPKPWLPVLSGRIVGSADQSERFLWDLRRLVADRVATDYVGGLREASRAHGLALWLENYGHWGFPSEFLKYGSESDRVSGEYWVTGDLGSIECRAASSCANTYGRTFVSAESFTGGPAFQNAPSDLKARGDWSFCEGVNHVVLHVYIHQPWADKKPGVNAPWGTEFNRHNTWFEQSRTWIEYLRRSSWLLQQGHRVADVAYFIGEDAPKMTGVRQPELPPGRDFDYINSDVIENSLGVKNSLLTLPHGTDYRVLVLPDQPTMRPEVLRKIRDLVKAGAIVLGPRPSRSPSLKDFPKCDDEVRKLARELWGDADMSQPGERRFGKGRILWGKKLEEVFASLNLPPDFESSIPLRFTHRRSGDTDVYFVANPKAGPLTTTVAFRAGSKAPELWRADTGRRELPAVCNETDGVVRLPLTFGPHGSVFVVFRESAAPVAQRIVSVAHNGEVLLNTELNSASSAGEKGVAAGTFTLAGWVNPAADTALFAQTNRGVSDLRAARNDVIAPTHGGQFGDPARHAGCGLAVGRNGIVVLEHAADYFAATLVHAARLTNWTHVAVVYRDGRPTLYLDGKVACEGLRSDFIVHPGDKPGDRHDSYIGELGEFTQINHALSDSELARLMQTTRHTRTGSLAGRLEIERTADGHATGWAWEGGDYQVRTADGRTSTVNVAATPAPVDISGPWEVDFAPGSGAPERTTFERLVDWSKHSEDGIKHYAGKATYRKTIELPASVWEPRGKARLVLDLGDVRDLAVVRLNGKEFGPLWLAPWQVDVTDAARPGSNVLEVEIVNVWNNRLAGDAALPEGQRRSMLVMPTVTAASPLLKAGLLGPVRIRVAHQITLP